MTTNKTLISSQQRTTIISNQTIVFTYWNKIIRWKKGILMIWVVMVHKGGSVLSAMACQKGRRVVFRWRCDGDKETDAAWLGRRGYMWWWSLVGAWFRVSEYSCLKFPPVLLMLSFLFKVSFFSLLLVQSFIFSMSYYLLLFLMFMRFEDFRLFRVEWRWLWCFFSKSFL